MADTRICADCLSNAKDSAYQNLRDEAADAGIDFWALAEARGGVDQVAASYVSGGDSRCSAHEGC